MRRKRKRKIELGMPAKANKILNGILIVLVLIVVRIWHVAVIQHDDKVEASKKPQRRTVVERAERATIKDRFGILLATNKVQYNAAVSYADVREIPRIVWKVDEQGKRVKCHRRKEYIAQLAHLLAKELELDAERIEDLLHSKASVFGSVPFVIKENISEKEYFRLKMLEKDWPGIRSELVAKRTYPLGAVGGEVLGYLGAISTSEYEAITKEMRMLREAVSHWNEGEISQLPEGFASFEEVEKRLNELEGKAYTINDYVGKAGVEGAFDEELRGRRGKRVYLSDTRGHYLQELPGSESPVAGNQLYLSISSELQEYAERLLTEYEQAPTGPRIKTLRQQSLLPPLQPWIKGGAIVAMHPITGEILALASYPRFNPNDFIRSGDPQENAKKKEKVNHWLENEAYLASLWNLKQSYSRERFHIGRGEFYEEAFELKWDKYISSILPEKSPVRLALEGKATVGHALFIQKKMDELLTLFEQEGRLISASKIVDVVYQNDDEVPTGSVPTLQERDFLAQRYQVENEKISQIKNELKPYFQLLPLNEDKLLLTDLFRLVIDPERVSSMNEERLKRASLQDFREASARFVSTQEALRIIVKEIHHQVHFKNWREKYSKQYLVEKRKEEAKEKKKFGRPYIDYLDEAEGILFTKFWEAYKWTFLAYFLGPTMQSAAIPELEPYFQKIREWKKEIHDGIHQELPWVGHYQRLETLLEGLQGKELIAFLKTLRSFEDLKRPLLGRYSGLRSIAGELLEKHLAMAFYPVYGYGCSSSHAYRQAATIGSIFKIVPAYEVLCQRYLALSKNGNVPKDLNPLEIIDDKHQVKGGGWVVGYTTDGKPIPRFFHGGLLPRTEHSKVGWVDLVRALEVSSNPYFALVAGEFLKDPEDLCKAARTLGYGEKTHIDLVGEFPGKIPMDVAYNRTGLYSMAIGQHSLVGTPLQTAVMLSAIVNGGKILKPKIVSQQKINGELFEVPTEVKREIFLPPVVQHTLLTGLRQVVMGEKGNARVLRTLFPPEIFQNLIGKTSTAEITERLGVGASTGPVKCKLVWFGGISYDSYAAYEFTYPNLVVIVYLRFGDFGREAAPYAAKMVEKWKEISMRGHNLPK